MFSCERRKKPYVDLTQQQCVPCDSGPPPLEPAAADQLLVELNHDWELVDGRVTKQFGLKNFRAVIAFVTTVMEIAEVEGHHPDLNIHDYRLLTVSLITHAIHGLSGNDFILAAKIQAAYDQAQ